jgi:myo-inositol-1(or 4)-monophosphatase
MWQTELETALEAARLAGDILVRMSHRANRVEKKGAIDLVTEADKRSEEAVFELLERRHPEDGILSEESEARSGTSGRRWIVDPLDGTVNFAHGFPCWAVSVALEAAQEIVVGVVLDPSTGEVFEAVRGEGAWLNGERLRVSATGDLDDALLCTGFPYDIREEPERVLRLFEALILRCQGVRRPGSAALDLCYVAAGRADGFWEEKLYPWDTAAGVLLVREAGGIVSTFEGRPHRPEDKTLVAGNPPVHRAMVEVISSELEPAARRSRP